LKNADWTLWLKQRFKIYMLLEGIGQTIEQRVSVSAVVFGLVG
jgi:hypothetical protein